jgi:hypothetical protein
MKTCYKKISIPFLILFVFFTNSLKAQSGKDSLQAVNFFGTIYAVKNSYALELRELKPLIRNNPQSFKAFKKAKRLKVLSQSLNILSIVPTAAALYTEKESEFWIGISVAGLINGVAAYLMIDPYNKHITNCIKEYNKGNSFR